MKTNIKFSHGFSLIELLVSLVAGLIVIGAVGAFMMSSFQSNTDFVAATRLTQELRNSMDFISRELRRAGYDENAMDFLAVPDTVTAEADRTSDFSTMLISGSCVVYAYDRSPGTPGVVDRSNGEIRAIRRTVQGGVGVMEFAESISGLTPACGADGPNYTTYPATCNATTGWCALSDPRILNVSEFTLDTSGYINVAGSTGINPVQIRDVIARLKGNLVGDPDVTRAVESSIRIRADCMRTSCNVSPTGTD